MNAHQAPASRRLSFLYLANDVIQHSKRRSGNYAREFETILPGVFGTTLNGLDHDTKGKIYRILEVWRERNVYEPQFLDLLAAKAKLDTIGAAQSHTHASHHPHGRHQMPQNQLATAAAPLPKPSVPLAPALGRTPKNTGLAKSVKFAPDTKPGHEYDDNALARAQESDSGAGAVESASLLVPEKLRDLLAQHDSALWERRTRLKVAEDQLAQLESTAQRAEPADDDGLAAINAKSAILVGATAPSGLLSSMPSTNTLSDPQSSGAAAISAEGASTIGHDGFGTSDFAAAFVNDGFSGGNHQATLDRISLTWPDDNPLGFDL
nr:Regulation of nuclear pre-mRNA domain containing protein 1B [Polyrhizophydium stewartii]